MTTPTSRRLRAVQAQDMAADTAAEVVEIVTAAIDKYLAGENYEVRRRPNVAARILLTPAPPFRGQSGGARVPAVIEGGTGARRRRRRLREHAKVCRRHRPARYPFTRGRRRRSRRR